MRTISNTTGSDGDSETPREDGDSSTPFTGKKFYQDLIRRANSIPITRLFKHYGLRLDEGNRKTICPFSFHNGGRENSASFWWYPHTNTFWCFGCKTGVGCCDLVASMEGITKVKAAFKILDLFHSDVDDDNSWDRENFSEKLEIMMEFSNAVREFRRDNLDEKSQAFIEHICWVYDTINLKHNLSNDALRSVVTQLRERINSYTLCPAQ
jgi:hypothetical protein